jgi:hypothetical protein
MAHSPLNEAPGAAPPYFSEILENVSPEPERPVPAPHTNGPAPYFEEIRKAAGTGDRRNT